VGQGRREASGRARPVDATSAPSRQESEDHRPRRIVLVQVDQQLAEGPSLRVPPELAYPVGPVEVGEAQDMVEFGASRACRQADDPGEVRDPL
jgi:hypothetical protein